MFEYTEIVVNSTGRWYRTSVRKAFLVSQYIPGIDVLLPIVFVHFCIVMSLLEHKWIVGPFQANDYKFYTFKYNLIETFLILVYKLAHIGTIR